MFSVPLQELLFACLFFAAFVALDDDDNKDEHDVDAGVGVGLFGGGTNTRQLSQENEIKGWWWLGGWFLLVAEDADATATTSQAQRTLFLVAQMSVCCVCPTLIWHLQRHKTIVKGPWDIAHLGRGNDNDTSDEH
jgi:hypothetical protein